MANKNYVDNERLYAEMVVFCVAAEKAKANNQPRPRPSNYIGEVIMLIAKNLSNKGNFVNYPFKEDMISDGIENCIAYIHSFNYRKYKNPFAYFTTIIYFAFQRRITKEKKILFTKNRYYETLNLSGGIYADLNGNPNQSESFQVRRNEETNDWDDDYYKAVLEKKEQEEKDNPKPAKRGRKKKVA